MIELFNCYKDVIKYFTEVPARPPKAPIRTPSQIRKTIQLESSPPQPHDDWHTTGCIPADDKVFSG